MKYVMFIFSMLFVHAGFTQTKLSITQIDTLGKTGKIDFTRYKGNKFLLVNVDTKDSTYKQFSDLVALSARISGCKVVVFPSENSPTLAADLYKAFPNAFASKNLIVVHPQPVSGVNANQVYRWLANKTANGELSVNCNKPFYKILISREGTLEAVFGPAMKVTDTFILQAINK